jgi:uncharacterized repeat protein (TIGR02059 family)
MVHNRKAIWTIIILLLTLFLLPQGGMAAEVSLELSSNRAMPGNSISALGQAESNTWVSLKILDSQQNIVLFDAVKSDPEGNYQFIFVVPDLPLGSELIVNAGYGNRIASQILTVGEPGAVPLLLSAFTNEAGSMISMEFNQLMADPAGSHEQFTVLVNGKINPVTKVALNQNPARIDLTLSQPVKHGDIIKVSYTRGTVQSADHGVLEDFDQQTVKNMVPATSKSPGGSSASGTPKSGTAAINPKQGGSVSLGKEVIIEIPANALKGNTELPVKVQQIDATVSLPADSKLLSSVYEFMVGNQSNYNFDQPIIIKLQFNPALLGENEIATIYYYDESQSKWINIGGTVSGSIISVQVDHFTRFAVFSIPIPSPTALSDVEGHWAAPYIKEMYASGVIGGYPDGSFRPDNHISRAEFVTMLVKSYQWETAGSKTFADTANHWARDYIAVAYARQIAKGYNDTRFGPDDYITREQMAVMLAQAAELRNVTGTRTFSDQERISPWAREAVAAASSKGIINGYPDKSFKPKDKATRGEAITVLLRSLDS